MKTAVISMVTAEIHHPINTIKTHVIITILQVITITIIIHLIMAYLLE